MVYSTHYPQGGMNDCVADFDTIEECIEWANKHGGEEIEVVDLLNKKGGGCIDYDWKENVPWGKRKRKYRGYNSSTGYGDKQEGGFGPP